jgi:hypothetical protein
MSMPSLSGSDSTWLAPHLGPRAKRAPGEGCRPLQIETSAFGSAQSGVQIARKPNCTSICVKQDEIA